MTYNYPFFRFPHMGRYPSYPPHYANYSAPVDRVGLTPRTLPAVRPRKEEPSFSQKGENFHTNDTIKEKAFHQKSERQSINLLSNLFHQEDREDEEPFFEIFGLKLYYDDMLLIGLIFFLYQEEVKDQYLFIALILLLLS
ncbi:MAG: hypothetical protein IJ777_02015 [Clostridia bacterium]|nr:hypothetical protein [Clostridia bacterium]